MYLFYDVFNFGEYDDILTLLEYFADFISNEENGEEQYLEDWDDKEKTDVYKDLNELFKKEFIGYRFIDKKIVQITNEMEIK